MSSDSQRLNTRLASAQPSATYRIIDRVAERRTQGATIISLCAGEPDFDTPAHVRAAAIDAIEHGHTRYTQVAGVRALRE
ncbi:aspartate transaminase, partial [Pseudomonas gingeri]|nr:aspartate transaminase [Pseudomonas gingeri]